MPRLRAAFGAYAISRGVFFTVVFVLPGVMLAAALFGADDLQRAGAPADER